MLSRRCKELMVIDKFTYSFHKHLADGMQRWKCTNRGCKAYFKRNSENELFDQHLEHNHSHLDETLLRRKAISNSLKRKAQDRLHEGPWELIRGELEPADLDRLTTNDVNLIQKCIHYARSRYLSNSTQGNEDVVESYQSSALRDALEAAQSPQTVSNAANTPEMSSSTTPAPRRTPRKVIKSKRYADFETEEPCILSTELTAAISPESCSTVSPGASRSPRKTIKSEHYTDFEIEEASPFITESVAETRPELSSTITSGSSTTPYAHFETEETSPFITELATPELNSTLKNEHYVEFVTAETSHLSTESTAATRPELSTTRKTTHADFETEETRNLSTEQLQRLLLIEQLKLTRIQTAYYEKKMKALPQ